MTARFEALSAPQLQWRDGLPYSTLFDDVYFAATDGYRESMHVFIDGNQLRQRFAQEHSRPFVIGDMGFGTGLNMLLAWKLFDEFAPPDARLHFYCVEKHPLQPDDLCRCLALWPSLAPYAAKLLAVYPIALTPGFHACALEPHRVQLTLMLGDASEMFEELLVCGDVNLEQQGRTWSVDAWFLDGFAPAKNPAMWSMSLFALMVRLSTVGTTVATFSAAGIVRRGLEAAGFRVTKAAGFGLKKHITHAQLVTLPTHTGPTPRTPWHVGCGVKPHVKHAIVLGAGLAGCFMAYKLSQRGWRVTLLERGADVGQGGSGNRQAVLLPHLSSHRSKLSQFMLASFLYAIPEYRALLAQSCVGGRLNGVVQWRTSKAQLVDLFKAYPTLGGEIKAGEQDARIGVSLKDHAIFLDDAGWLDSPSLCRALVEHAHIECVFNQTVSGLQRNDGLWQVGAHQAPVLVIANGPAAALWPQTAHLPLRSALGQMTAVVASASSARLNMPLCGDGHVSPAHMGVHWVGGAHYEMDESIADCSLVRDEANLKKLAALAVDCEWSMDALDHWAGVRATTPDYLPVVGPVVHATEFMQQYANWRLDGRRVIASMGSYVPGLYVCAGFGSRGVTTIPLCCNYLAACINQEPSPLPRSMMQSLSSARFLRQDLIRLKSDACHTP